jgi:hypothetical protein
LKIKNFTIAKKKNKEEKMKRMTTNKRNKIKELKKDFQGRTHFVVGWV